MSEEKQSKTFELLERERLIRGALGITYNEAHESCLMQILFTRREAAKKLQLIAYNSVEGGQCMEIIKFCNEDIKRLLIL